MSESQAMSHKNEEKICCDLCSELPRKITRYHSKYSLFLMVLFFHLLWQDLSLTIRGNESYILPRVQTGPSFPLTCWLYGKDKKTREDVELDVETLSPTDRPTMFSPLLSKHEDNWRLLKNILIVNFQL